MPQTSSGYTVPASTDAVNTIPTTMSTMAGQINTNVNARIAASTVTAKGDLIAATGSGAVTNVAVGADGTVLTADSTQASGVKWSALGTPTWTTRLAPGTTANTLLSIVSNGSNIYVAAGKSGVLYSSSDGKTWTSRTSGFGTNDIYKVAYGNGLFVAVGLNGTITTSTDGITWTARTSNMGTNTIWDVIYANSLWVAVGNGGGSVNTGGITYSSDGLTWTRKSQSVTVGSTYNCVIWNGTYWVVGATSSTNNYLYATTPSGSWTTAAIGGAVIMYGLFWDGTRTLFIIGADWFSSTSSTLVPYTNFSNFKYSSQAFSTFTNACFYNGRIHQASIYYQSCSTSSIANSYVDSSTPAICPGSYSEPLTSGMISAIHVNAAGVILGGLGSGIWTSF